MSAATIATVALAVLGFLSLIFAGFAWLYKRGADERELTIAVQQNTHATTKLSEHMNKIAETLAVHGEKLADHDARLRAGGL